MCHANLPPREITILWHPKSQTRVSNKKAKLKGGVSARKVKSSTGHAKNNLCDVNIFHYRIALMKKAALGSQNVQDPLERCWGQSPLPPR